MRGHVTHVVEQGGLARRARLVGGLARRARLVGGLARRARLVGGLARRARLVGGLARERKQVASRAPAGGSRQAQQQFEPARGRTSCSLRGAHIAALLPLPLLPRPLHQLHAQPLTVSLRFSIWCRRSISICTNSGLQSGVSMWANTFE